MTTKADGQDFGDYATVEDIPPKPTDSEGKPVEGAVPVDPLAALKDSLRANTWAAMADKLAARVVARNDGSEKPVPSPWPTFDKTMGGGLWPGVHFLVGGTGAGKSQWAIQVAIKAASEATPVLYLALELDELGLFTRGASFLCGLTEDTHGTGWERTKWSEFYTGKVKGVPSGVVEALKTLPFHWIVAPPHGWQYAELVASVEALRALYPQHVGPVVVVVDFLQLVASGNEREELRERISRAAHTARAVARDADAVVMVLSSTARDGYGKAVVKVGGSKRKGEDSGDAEPQFPEIGELVGLGKESGDVEYAADSVLVLCPETYANEDDKPRGSRRMHLAVAKLRAGPPGWVPLTFDGTRFEEATDTRGAPSSAVPVNVRGAGKKRGTGKRTPKDKALAPMDPWDSDGATESDRE